MDLRRDGEGIVSPREGVQQEGAGLLKPREEGRVVEIIGVQPLAEYAAFEQGRHLLPLTGVEGAAVFSHPGGFAHEGQPAVGVVQDGRLAVKQRQKAIGAPDVLSRPKTVLRLRQRDGRR